MGKKVLEFNLCWKEWVWFLHRQDLNRWPWGRKGLQGWPLLLFFIPFLCHSGSSRTGFSLVESNGNSQQDTQRKQGTWKRWRLVPQKGHEFSPTFHPAPLEQGASGFARDHLDFGLSVICLALLNLWLQYNSDFWQLSWNLAVWHVQEEHIKPFAVNLKLCSQVFPSTPPQIPLCLEAWNDSVRWQNWGSGITVVSFKVKLNLPKKGRLKMVKIS